MVQKLLVKQRDTSEEMMKAIQKDIKEFKIISLSVLKGLSGYEAWIIIDDQMEELAGFE
jgi:ribosomal protein S25